MKKIMSFLSGHPLTVILFILCLGMAMLCIMGCGGSFQSETTVLGIEVQTFATGSTPMPTARAGLIRHKDQFTKDGQAARFYNSESGVNLWGGSLGNAMTSMSCSSNPDSASKNEVQK